MFTWVPCLFAFICNAVWDFCWREISPHFTWHSVHGKWREQNIPGCVLILTDKAEFSCCKICCSFSASFIIRHVRWCSWFEATGFFSLDFYFLPLCTQGCAEDVINTFYSSLANSDIQPYPAALYLEGHARRGYGWICLLEEPTQMPSCTPTIWLHEVPNGLTLLLTKMWPKYLHKPWKNEMCVIFFFLDCLKN